MGISITPFTAISRAHQRKLNQHLALHLLIGYNYEILINVISDAVKQGDQARTSDKVKQQAS